MRIVVRLTPTVRKLKETLPPEAQIAFEQCLDELGRNSSNLPEEDAIAVSQHTVLWRPAAGCLVIHREVKRLFRREILQVTIKHLVPAKEFNDYVRQHWLTASEGGSGPTENALLEVMAKSLDHASRFDLLHKLLKPVLGFLVLALISMGAKLGLDATHPNFDDRPQIEERERVQPSHQEQAKE